MHALLLTSYLMQRQRLYSSVKGVITLIQPCVLCTTPGMSEWHFAAATGICSQFIFSKRDAMQQCSSKSTQIHCLHPLVSICETRKSQTFSPPLFLLLSLNKGQSIANAKHARRMQKRSIGSGRPRTCVRNLKAPAAQSLY